MDYPVLGVLDNDELTGDGLAEAFIAACDGKKLIVVTSEHVHEGKTSTCRILAKRLKEAGNKVLVIDADLRKPVILSEEFRMRKHMYTDKSYMDYAVNTGDYVYVGVATLGKKPREVFASEKFAELLQTARARFDYTLIDSSPIGLFEDSEIIDGDGILYVHSPMFDDITRELKNVVGVVECRMMNGKGHDKKAGNSTIRR